MSMVQVLRAKKADGTEAIAIRIQHAAGWVSLPLASAKSLLKELERAIKEAEA